MGNLLPNYKKKDIPYMLQMVSQDEFFTITDHEVYWDEVYTILGDNLKFRMIANSFHFMLQHEEQAAALTPKQRHALDVTGDFANTIYSGFDYPNVIVDAVYPDDNTVNIEIAYPADYAFAGLQVWTGEISVFLTSMRFLQALLDYKPWHRTVTLLLCHLHSLVTLCLALALKRLMEKNT